MKALVYTAPHHLEIQEPPEPAGDSLQCVVRVRASGICGSDLDGFLGKSKKRIPPLVLGHEFSGEVVADCEAARSLRQGQRVAVYPLVSCGHCRYCQTRRHHICPTRKVFGLDFDGGLAEFVSVPHKCLFPMPEHMSFVEGALVEPLANALHVLSRCESVQGATGVVFGGGLIGMFTLWAAKHAGAARVAVVDVNARRLRRLSALNPNLVVDASRMDPVSALMEWTGGAGVDFAIDATSNPETRAHSVRCLAPGGTAVWIGLSGDTAEVDARAIVTREIEIKGSYAYGFDDFGRALAILSEKTFPVDAVVSRAALDDGQAVFEDLAGGHTSLMKVVFDV